MVPRLAIPLGMGALCGSIVGSNLIQYGNEKTLQYLFSGVMFVLGVRSLGQAARMIR